MQRIISNQLKSFPILEKGLRIAYYSPTPGKEIHMDTGFWQPSGEPNQNLVPILVIVDVATRFTKIFIQTRKNESIANHFKTFIKELKHRFPKQVSSKHLLSVHFFVKPFRFHYKHAHPRPTTCTMSDLTLGVRRGERVRSGGR